MPTSEAAFKPGANAAKRFSVWSKPSSNRVSATSGNRPAASSPKHASFLEVKTQPSARRPGSGVIGTGEQHPRPKLRALVEYDSGGTTRFPRQDDFSG